MELALLVEDPEVRRRGGLQCVGQRFPDARKVAAWSSYFVLFFCGFSIYTITLSVSAPFTILYARCTQELMKRAIVWAKAWIGNGQSYDKRGLRSYRQGTQTRRGSRSYRQRTKASHAAAFLPEIGFEPPSAPANLQERRHRYNASDENACNTPCFACDGGGFLVGFLAPWMYARLSEG